MSTLSRRRFLKTTAVATADSTGSATQSTPLATGLTMRCATRPTTPRGPSSSLRRSSVISVIAVRTSSNRT